jgi:hypothetical protein
MRLVSNWKEVTLYSWSFRLNLILAATSALEAGASYLADGKISSALIVCGISIAASVSRLVKQVTVSGEDKPEETPLGIGS